MQSWLGVGRFTLVVVGVGVRGLGVRGLGVVTGQLNEGCSADDFG
jgi:hypothetical protein